MVELSIRVDVKPLTKALYGLEREQIPFATAQALTAVAKLVKAGETAGFDSTFKNPTPFTMNAIGVTPARKATLTATVFVKDIQAVYLAPFAFGGTQALGNKRAILTPRDVAVNQYGNIPKGRIAALRGRPDIYIGEVRTKGGKVISGVWQRVGLTRTGKRRRIKAGVKQPPGQLKLLIQFTNPAPVTHQLDYMTRAKAIVDRNLGAEWSKAIAAALSTAR
jgi:hypothetical protein